MKILPRIDVDGEPTDLHLSVDYYYICGVWWSDWQVKDEPETLLIEDAEFKVTVTTLYHYQASPTPALEIEGSILWALNDALPASLQRQY